VLLDYYNTNSSYESHKTSIIGEVVGSTHGRRLMQIVISIVFALNSAVYHTIWYAYKSNFNKSNYNIFL